MTCCPADPCLPAEHELTLGRRRFLRLVALGAGATLWFSAAPRRAFAGGEAEALVLTCMDYRLADDVHRFMDGQGLTDRYDHVVLAGASAGVMHPKFAGWRDTFWDHLKVSIDLHRVRRLMVIDHRDCGAYKLAFATDLAADPAKETEAHAGLIRELAAEVAARHPTLQVEGYLMGLDGWVETVEITAV